MSRRSSRLVIAAVAATALMTTACGGADNSVKKDPNTIVYWDLIDPTIADNPRSEALRDSISTFEQANPGVKIKVQTIPWPQISPKLLQASAANETPDVVRLLAWDLPKHVESGDLEPLDKLASDKYKSDWLLGWDTLTFDGKKMAVPMEYRASTLFTRRDLLGKQPIPTSWDAMISEGKKAASGKVNPVMMGFGKAAGGTVITEPLVSYLWDAGLEVFDDKGHVGFDSPEGYAVFDRLAALVKDGVTPKSASSYQYEDVYQSLKASNGVFTLLGSHRGNAARSDAKLTAEQLVMTPLPGMKSDSPAPAHVMGWTFVIPKGAADVNTSWKFIEHLTSAENQLNQVKLTGELPTRESPYQDPWFASAEGKEVKALAAWFAEGRTLDYGTHWTQFGEFCSDALTSMILRGTSAEEAVSQLAKRYNALADKDARR